MRTVQGQTSSGGEDVGEGFEFVVHRVHVELVANLQLLQERRVELPTLKMKQIIKLLKN